MKRKRGDDDKSRVLKKTKLFKTINNNVYGYDESKPVRIFYLAQAEFFMLKEMRELQYMYSLFPKTEIIVGVTNGRSNIPINQRAEILRHLKYVVLVIDVTSNLSIELIRKHRINYIVTFEDELLEESQPLSIFSDAGDQNMLISIPRLENNQSQVTTLKSKICQHQDQENKILESKIEDQKTENESVRSNIEMLSQEISTLENQIRFEKSKSL